MADSGKLPEWAIGPFSKYGGNPVLSPTGNGWEGWTTYNPAVVVKDDRFYMAYRAEPVDRVNEYMGVSQIGIAVSDDGFHFDRCPGNPAILTSEAYELPGGCEDPRIVRHGDRYFMTYTGYQWPDAVCICLAVSSDLLVWRKLGPMFAAEPDTKSGCIVQDPQANAVEIDGRYVMYTNSHIAYSRNFTDWDIHRFDRGMPGEACVAVTDYRDPGNDNIILFYAGSLEGRAENPGWHYAVSESLYSREEPELMLDALDSAVLVPTRDEEKDADRLGENGAKGCVFMDSIIRYGKSWWVHYGASDRHVCVATCPA